MTTAYLGFGVWLFRMMLYAILNILLCVFGCAAQPFFDHSLHGPTFFPVASRHD